MREIHLQIPDDDVESFLNYARLKKYEVTANRTVLEEINMERTWEEEVAEAHELLIKITTAKDQGNENQAQGFKDLHRFFVERLRSIQIPQDTSDFSSGTIAIFEDSVRAFQQMNARPGKSRLANNKTVFTYDEPVPGTVTPRDMRLLSEVHGLSGEGRMKHANVSEVGIASVSSALEISRRNLSRAFAFKQRNAR
ncbi:MAG: hypothetical protein KA035_01785 [Candidatus Levybacteria bacterium]|nr:hypothetical protein [Candidatus Levybacteria bacterium]